MTQQTTSAPKISIIIPVYNAEKYLRECIDSVINQDIGFVKNIELVLVNDGSIDSSDAICLEYAQRYPQNVIYVEQENAGASEARNAGISKAIGGIIGFIDADDYITRDVVSSVMKYFRSAPHDVDLATIRVVQFGSKNKERPINKKFIRGTRTADLKSPEWYDVNPRVAPGFIRSEVARRYCFHKDIRFYEDTRYVTEVLSETMKMGIVAKGVYYNRMHEPEDTEASITTGATSEQRFYSDSPASVSLHLLEKYKRDGKHPPEYYQFLAMYEMRWRMFYNPHSADDVLPEAELNAYRETNRKILSLLSDETIVANKLYNVRQRAYMLSLKHNYDILSEAEFAEDDRLLWRGLIIFNHMKAMAAKVTGVNIEGRTLVLQGFFHGFMVNGLEVFPRIDKHNQYGAISLRDDGAGMAVEDEYDDDRYKRTSFLVKMPLSPGGIHQLDFGFKIRGTQYPIKYLNRALLFEGVEKPPRYSEVGDYMIAWYGDKLRVTPAANRFNCIVLMAHSTIAHLYNYGLRGLRKIKRLCTQMIRMRR